MEVHVKVDNKELLERYKNGEKELKETILLNNISLVYSIINKYRHSSTSKDDLFQIGCIGLLKAIDNFDSSYDVMFSTYAVPLILGEIKKHFRDDGLIKVSRGLKELSIKINKEKNDYYIKQGKEITLEELSTKLNVSKYDLIIAMDSNYMPTSLEQSLNNDEDYTLEDTIKDESQKNIVDLLTLKESIKLLNDKEKLFINLRYYKNMNQQEIATKFNVSQVQISRIEKKIIDKLKKCF